MTLPKSTQLSSKRKNGKSPTRTAGKPKPEEFMKSRPTVSLGLRRSPAPARESPSHRYHVGDSVIVTPDPTALVRAGGLYRILAILPPNADGRLQYRVRSELERFERIVKEDEMGAARGVSP